MYPFYIVILLVMALSTPKRFKPGFSFLLLLTAFSLTVILSGCPFSSAYQIDKEPQFLVDDNYLGKWAAITIDDIGMKRPVKMILSRKTDYEYDIIFTGYFDELNKRNIAYNDTIKGTGFMSLVDNRQFFNIKVKEQFYLAEFSFEDGKITMLPLCEHFTNRIVKSNEDLRKSIQWHFKTRLYPLYDDPFCLRNMVRVN